MPEIAPLLIPWRHGNERQRARMQSTVRKLAVERPAVSFVESDYGLEELGRHFRPFHLVKLPNGREMLLRWYDTRILPVWLSVMTPKQKSGFVEGIRQWRMYDRYGDAIDLPLSVNRGEELPALPPYTLDEVQYADLLEACGPDVLIAHLREVAPDQMRALPQRVLYPFVQEHLAQARGHGLNNLDDQGHYLILALSTSGRFLEHSHVRERLALRADEHGQPFGDWAMSVPDTVFETGTPLWEHEFPEQDPDARMDDIA